MLEQRCQFGGGRFFAFSCDFILTGRVGRWALSSDWSERMTSFRLRMFVTGGGSDCDERAMIKQRRRLQPMSKTKSHLSHPVFHLADEVMRVSGRIAGIFSEATAQSGLSPLAYATFVYVAESPFPPTVPQIGRSLGYARQVIQRSVNELIAEGFLEAMPNPNHKRAPLLQLTRSGGDFKQISDARVNAIAKALQRYVSEDKCRKLLRDLHDLRTQIEEYSRHETDAHANTPKRKRGASRLAVGSPKSKRRAAPIGGRLRAGD
jgi:DNA-binding MarR family transcriptional regulator